MKRFGWCLGVLMTIATVAQAAGPAAVRKQVESSMLVSGTIDIEADGDVRNYSYEQVEALPKGVVGFLDSAIPQWKFEPLPAGSPAVVTRSRFRARLVAKKFEDGTITVRVAGASFDSTNEAHAPHGRGPLRPPRYPDDAAQAAVGGTVYLVLRFGRDGKVTDVVAEQVNLKVVASEADMDMWRRRLASVAVSNARGWTFDPPAEGPDADDSIWSVRVPTDFVIGRNTAYGRWETYVPGPRQPVPWRSDEDAARISADTIATGEVQLDVANGPQLITPLNRG